MRARFTWIVIILIIIGTLFFYLESNDGLFDNNREENFLIGKWVLQRGQSSAQFSIYELEFVDSNNLICNTSDNGQENYNIKFHYNYIGENRIKIIAPRRLSSEWEVIDEGGQLVVNSSPWPGGVGIFRRGTTVNWPSIALLLSFCVIGTFFITIPRTKMENGKLGASASSQNQPAGSSGYVIHSLIALVFFISGVMGGFLIWSLSPLLRVRLPWDAVITLELSAVLFIFGIRTLIANHRAFTKSIISWNCLLAVFLIGAGALGIIIGAGRLFIFTETGFYP
jgi:hypothetical protein